MLRTTSQIKTMCTECPVARTANLVGDTFALLIVRDLLEKPKRFGELVSSLSGVSSRTIASKLKFLEQKHIVSRSRFKEKPPRVLYELTPNGKALHKIIEDMRSYGEKYL